MSTTGYWVASISICLPGALALTPISSAQITFTLRSDGPNCIAPGAPFQGERVTKTLMYLQDGKPLTQEEHELLGRDAEGRFFDQSFRLAMPGHPEAHSDMIVDPIAHRLVAWRSGTHKAVGDPLPPATHLDVAALAPDRRMQEAQFPKGKSNVTTENLGMKTIGGVLATGTRTVTVLPTGAAGNSQPLESSQEIWVANDLRIVVSETDTSPFSGTRKVEMLSLERTAPPANRFEVPSDMTVVMKSLPGFAQEMPIYWKALDDIKKPETKEQAAADLIAYAETHESVANHVAHVLAAAKTHLKDADALGRESVMRSEQTSAAIELDHVTLGDLSSMEELAEYWDSLGWVRWADGDKESAKRYCRVAWNLGGEGLYLDHVARIAMEDGEKDTARHMLQVSLSGQSDDREKNQIRGDLSKLDVADATAIDEPTTVVIPSPLPTQGTAEFLLLFTGDTKPVVKWVGGDEKLALQVSEIARANYPPQTPDDGPEHVIRRARLVCQLIACKLTLLYAYQAVPTKSPLSGK